MEQLSVDLFQGILSHLELSEQIQLRRVCKDWMRKIDSMEKRLTISSASKQASYEYGLNLVQDHIRAATIDTVLGLLKKPILSNLKSLCVYKLDVEKKSGPFCKALSFDQLDELTISCIENLDKHVELRLPNLRRVFIGYLRAKKITLDAPKLKDVKIRFGKGHFDFEFVHPSVECIELDKFSKSLESAELKKNLQRLYCQEIADVGDEFLKGFEKLEELHFNRKLQAFGVLFNQKKNYNCVNLKIYFNGLRVDSLNEFEGWFNSGFMDDDFGEIFSVKLIDLYIQNYSRLANRLPFYTGLSYQRIEDRVPRLPSDFFRRLVNVNGVATSKQVKSVKDYLNFLRANFKNLAQLGVLYELPPQIFFNLLPRCVPSIRSIMISRADSYFTGVELPDIDLNFIFELKDLVLFSCNIEFSDAFIRKVYAELPNIETLFFKYGDVPRMVATREPNVFQLQVGSYLGSEPKFNNVNDLIKHLKKGPVALGMLAGLGRLRFR